MLQLGGMKWLGINLALELLDKHQPNTSNSWKYTSLNAASHSTEYYLFEFLRLNLTMCLFNDFNLDFIEFFSFEKKITHFVITIGHVYITT